VEGLPAVKRCGLDERQKQKTVKRPYMTKKLMCGIDLHSNNLFCGVVDQNGKRVFEKKLPCDLPSLLKALKPIKSQIHTITVESTFNWYWLVDGLQDNGYNVVLANPNKIIQYNGIKQTNDKSDAFFLAELLRLEILPTGHICDRRLRPVRDLLRRRMGLVHKRTSLMPWPAKWPKRPGI
jgi:transposase